jgi:hypothetical protein
MNEFHHGEHREKHTVKHCENIVKHCVKKKIEKIVQIVWIEKINKIEESQALNRQWTCTNVCSSPFRGLGGKKIERIVWIEKIED